ncbi:hypothetical protein BDR26DRAFT_851330 [Obelidium mucronatum]|nr:hypothetical protein BDR26DRAFT_851330 [Obelidium mucronatum]
MSADDAAQAARASGGIKARIAALGLNDSPSRESKTQQPSIGGTNLDRRSWTQPVSPVSITPIATTPKKQAPPPPPSRSTRASVTSASSSPTKTHTNAATTNTPDQPTFPPRPPAPPSPNLRRRASHDSQSTISTAAGGDHLNTSSSLRNPVGLGVYNDENSHDLQQQHDDRGGSTCRLFYIIPATEKSIFPVQDIKLLFGNVDVLIETSSSVLECLGVVVGEDRIGDGFLELAPAIEESYTEYCKNNESAMTKLFDYSSPETSDTVKQFWKECQSNLTGRTNAWDLSSLLIKPVQRVLKYPLLLGQLLKETPETHSDHGQLLKAFNEMSRIAEEINFVKRRKDTVDKYVEGKGGVNVMHGLSKKFNRGIEELKHATKVVDGTKDDLYHEIYEKFNLQHNRILQFSKDLTSWLKAVKESLEAQEMLATGLEEVYMLGNTMPQFSSNNTSTSSINNNTANSTTGSGSRTSTASSLSGGGHLLTVAEYRRICAKLAYEPWKDAEAQVKDQIVPAITTLMTRLGPPLLLIKKRDSKLLDHDRAKRIKAKGEQPVDKVLQDSSDAYVSINAELIAELPKLTGLMTEYMEIVVGEFVRIQRKVYETVMNDLKVVVNSFEVAYGGGGGRMMGAGGGGGGGGGGNIVEDFKIAVLNDREILKKVWEIGILENWREQVWRNDDYDATVADDNVSTRTGGAGSTLGRNPKASNSIGGFGFTRAGSHSVASRRGTESIRTTRTGGGGIDDDEVSGISVTGRPSSRPSSMIRPFNYQQPLDAFEVVALYAFEPEMDDELEMQAGEVVWVYATSGRNGDVENQDWWHARSSVDGREGWIPNNYVQRT